jgi:uncharacterized protein (TIGR03083 family)
MYEGGKGTRERSNLAFAPNVRLVPSRLQYSDHVAAVTEEISALAESVGAVAPFTSVPTCPDWTVADLASHVGQFCGFWTHVLCEGTGRPKTPFPFEPENDPAEWLRELGSYLVAELVATPPDTEVWTWYEDDTSGAFVARRCAHELAVHRYDAQSAGSACTPIAAPLAADGIDEVLTTLVEARRTPGEATGQSFCLDATDVDASWLVTLQPDRIDVGRRVAHADLWARGTASDLELLLYGRPVLGEVERSGDDAVLDAWQREFLF